MTTADIRQSEEGYVLVMVEGQPNELALASSKIYETVDFTAFGSPIS